MSNWNYYGVIGQNGIAVMDSWAGVQKIRKYLRGIACHGFNNFYDAEDWALRMFEERFPRESGKVLSLQVNCAVFVSKLRTGDEW